MMRNLPGTIRQAIVSSVSKFMALLLLCTGRTFVVVTKYGAGPIGRIFVSYWHEYLHTLILSLSILCSVSAQQRRLLDFGPDLKKNLIWYLQLRHFVDHRGSANGGDSLTEILS